MSIRKTLVVLSLAGLGWPIAFAQVPSKFVGGEIGWVDAPVQSTLTREQVRQEFLEFRKNPIGADGGRYVGGEAGYILPPLNPQSPKAKANPIKTPAERAKFQQDYPA